MAGWVITHGVAPGDQVVISGQIKLSDGARIEPITHSVLAVDAGCNMSISTDWIRTQRCSSISLTPRCSSISCTARGTSTRVTSSTGGGERRVRNVGVAPGRVALVAGSVQGAVLNNALYVSVTFFWLTPTVCSNGTSFNANMNAWNLRFFTMKILECGPTV